MLSIRMEIAAMNDTACEGSTHTAKTAKPTIAAQKTILALSGGSGHHPSPRCCHSQKLFPSPTLAGPEFVPLSAICESLLGLRCHGTPDISNIRLALNTITRSAQKKASSRVIYPIGVKPL